MIRTVHPKEVMTRRLMQFTQAQTISKVVLKPLQRYPSEALPHVGNECGTVRPTDVISTSYGYNEADLTPYYEQRQCNECSFVYFRKDVAELTPLVQI